MEMQSQHHILSGSDPSNFLKFLHNYTILLPTNHRDAYTTFHNTKRCLKILSLLIFILFPYPFHQGTRSHQYNCLLISNVILFLHFFIIQHYHLYISCHQLGQNCLPKIKINGRMPSHT